MYRTPNHRVPQPFCAAKEGCSSRGAPLACVFAGDQSRRLRACLIDGPLLFDPGLPTVDGLEVLGRPPRRPTKAVPGLVVTSSTTKQDWVNGYSLGADSYARKLVSFPQLADAMRQQVGVPAVAERASARLWRPT